MNTHFHASAGHDQVEGHNFEIDPSMIVVAALAALREDAKLDADTVAQAARLWDLEGKELVVLRGHDAPVGSAVS